MDKLKKYSIVWGLIVVLIFAFLTIFGFTYKEKTKPYKDLEKALVEAEKKYVDANFLYPQDGSELKTSASVLIENNYLDSLKKDDNECTGYATVLLNGTVYEYKGFIKCDNYTTKGYKE
jgi:heme/copper-type cytochrome/quinol oxidase subunit 2